MNYYNLIKPIAFTISPETAHNMAIWALRKNLLPKPEIITSQKLSTEVFGIKFPSPVGMAAGFDKNGDAIPGLFTQGFGFVEVGTATPKPQSGNKKPRLFRLIRDKAVINRFGFNNKGCDYFIGNLSRYKECGVIGANIGKNKETENALDDYLYMLKHVYGLSDYITINISSPNTPNLRNLQDRKELDKLLLGITKMRRELAAESGLHIPILLKIAPDVSSPELADITMNVMEHKIDGIIVSNTTISRDGLKSHNRKETGGLSGKPLFEPSNKVLGEVYRLTRGSVPIIGVGGIFSGKDAYEKIKLGASLVQVYSGLVYKGFGLVNEINQYLEEKLAEDGFSSISEAVGIGSVSG